MSNYVIPEGAKEILDKPKSDPTSVIKKRLIKHYIDKEIPFKCYYCKIDMTFSFGGRSQPDNLMTLEHKIPISTVVFDFKRKHPEVTTSSINKMIRRMVDHPINKIDNIVFACRKCNRERRYCRWNFSSQLPTDKTADDLTL